MTEQHKSITIQDAYDYYMLHHKASGHSSHTIEFYENRLPQFFAFIASDLITDINANEIRQYLSACRDRGLAAYTVHGYARCIRAFCIFLFNEGMIDKNPFTAVKMPRLPKQVLPAFSAEDIQALLKACNDIRERVMVLMLLDTGVRAEELITLKVTEVDVQNGEVLILSGKSDKDRHVFVGMTTRKAIKRYLIEWKPDPDGQLFLSAKGRTPLTTSGLFQLTRRLGRQAKVSPCTPHMFRRTHALNMLRNGCDIYRLARLMGHEDLQTLRRYLAWVKDDLKDAAETYGVVDSLPKK